MSRLIILSVILLGCTKNAPTYNLETLKSDISSLTTEDQTKIVNFSTKYELTKSFQDSISGIPVVLVQSLSYVEILDYIRKEKNKLFKIDSLNYLKIVNSTKQTITKDVNSITYEYWVIDENFLSETGLMLNEGRNFSPAFKSDSSSVLINQPLAEKLNLELGDNLQFEGTRQIIGILSNMNMKYPMPEPLIVAVLNNKDGNNR